ncbi:MAG: hypothetical protein JWM21_4066 [Acidobacteria bacterium]|nr:hypothetical protein [Acidobacteriota bacterium]
MILLIFAKHFMWSRPDGHGGTMTYYYYDSVTWIVGALALAWLAWFLISRYRRARALRRPARRINYRLLKRLVRIKSEFSSINLRPGFSRTIHAIGLGMLAATDEYCIQVFINDANAELWNGAGAAPLPATFRGVPVILIEMPSAGFLSAAAPRMTAGEPPYPNGIREQQAVIIGGISGANTNLTGQSGTIGYFCRRRSKLARRKEIHLLSNSHVFADLRKTTIDNSDLILQPSPGEPAGNRPIGTLVNFSALKFDADINEPNHIDAAIARLWGPQQHQPLIPMIGAIKGYVPKRDVAIGEAARKFGRTTGYTEGRVSSIYLDIWIRYDRTGQSAFFQNQFLIAPAEPGFTKFVSKGDSGSLVVDAEQHALGLIFAGMSEVPEGTKAVPKFAVDPNREKPPRIESYGVANPISEVLDRLKIDLLV